VEYFKSCSNVHTPAVDTNGKPWLLEVNRCVVYNLLPITLLQRFSNLTYHVNHITHFYIPTMFTVQLPCDGCDHPHRQRGEDTSGERYV
jgi:hypothetical protein